MDDTAGIGLLESVVLQDKVWKSKTIADMGIYPIATWHLQGRCSKHGSVNLTYESTEKSPENEGYLLCVSCKWDFGVDKWVPVQSAKKV